MMTTQMMVADPNTVRYAERLKVGKASINGVNLEPVEKSVELGRRIAKYRAEQTVAAIRKLLR